ncbi:hypothetical protein evm_002699 [Chilo suppressalis]|nr:hypothetical protein evm_002699 [Chilo suppressalis]
MSSPCDQLHFSFLLLTPHTNCQYSVHHPAPYIQNGHSDRPNPYMQQRNPQWHEFSSPRRRASEYRPMPQHYEGITNVQPITYNQGPFGAQTYAQNVQTLPQNYDGRSSYDFIQAEATQNDGRLLSDSAFTRISETLGAINTVGHYLVDMVNENERDETDPNLKQLPQALYTISKNVLGRNVTDKIAPIVKKALPRVLPDAPITKIATAGVPENDVKSCATPEGEEGVCEDLSNCPQLLLNLVNLRESLCFKDLFVPGVCCPKDSIVPATTLVEKPVLATTSKPTYLVPVTTQRPQKPPQRPVQKPTTTKKPSAILVLTTKRPSTTLTTVPTTARPLTVRPTTARPTTAIAVTTARPVSTTSFYTVSPPIITNFSNIVDVEECGQREDEGGRIVGGTEAKPGAWPWMAAIYLHGSKRREFWCGGTLVNRRHVLTAAHCTRDSKQRPFPARQFSVRLGDVDLAREDEPSRPVTLRVTEVRAHEQFSRVGFYNDIAILVLAENVQKSKYVIPICLPSGQLTTQQFDGAVGTVVGWGTTRYGGGESSRQLQARLPVWRNQDCDRAYFQPITDTFLCAGYARGGVDACQGDSGGPLMLEVNGRWTQIGVVSFGNKCGEPGYPGVYTRVTRYIPWLQQNML